jgi:hypothetical protein
MWLDPTCWKCIYIRRDGREVDDTWFTLLSCHAHYVSVLLLLFLFEANAQQVKKGRQAITNSHGHVTCQPPCMHSRAAAISLPDPLIAPHSS